MHIGHEVLSLTIPVRGSRTENMMAIIIEDAVAVVTDSGEVHFFDEAEHIEISAPAYSPEWD